MKAARLKIILLSNCSKIYLANLFLIIDSKENQNELKTTCAVQTVFYLVEVTENLTTSVLAASFFVVHDTVRGGQDQETELTSGQQVTNPLFHFTKLDVETGRDDTTLVQATVQLNDNLTSAVVINDFEFTNVTVLLHDLQELDDDLGGGADKNLTLSTLFGIVNALKSIVQHADTNHLFFKREKSLERVGTTQKS